ncbi:MAG TPA: hypothetical protein VH054_17020 [Polyangiaceae bacterium]|nr:hypothetical protein [Polyangiaceae bacterium]
MVDAGAFSEWILAKAEKQHGVASWDAKNIELVRRAVEAALQVDGEEIHVECTLDGDAGPIRIDERMTRSALGVLFAQVHVPAKKSTAARVKEVEVAPEPAPDSGSVREKERDARIARNVVIVIGLVVAGIVASSVAWMVEHDERHERHETHDKREMHR